MPGIGVIFDSVAGLLALVVHLVLFDVAVVNILGERLRQRINASVKRSRMILIINFKSGLGIVLTFSCFAKPLVLCADFCTD